MKRPFYILSLVVVAVISLLLSAWGSSPMSAMKVQPGLQVSLTPASTAADIIDPTWPKQAPTSSPQYFPEQFSDGAKGCPPEGGWITGHSKDKDKSGEPADNKPLTKGEGDQNILKNRTDIPTGAYYPVKFSAILIHLTWPKEVENRTRDGWGVPAMTEIKKYEGIPVAVEGYVARAASTELETTNCKLDDEKYKDWHIQITENPGDDLVRSIVVETTPRVRGAGNHSKWTLQLLNEIAKENLRVRISGWLFFDPAHPEDMTWKGNNSKSKVDVSVASTKTPAPPKRLSPTRGTIWEIHPVMKIEVFQNNAWMLLENCVILNKKLSCK